MQRQRKRSGGNPMAQGPRRGVSLGMPLTPIALLVLVAVLVAVATFPWGGATGTSADDRVAKSAGTSPGTLASRPVVHALGRLEPESGIVTVGVRPGVRVDRVAVKVGED